MRNIFLGVLLAVTPLAATGAQQADSTSPRADSLRLRIEERFAQRVQERLGLNSEQAAKLRETSRQFANRRREMASRERLIREAMAAQLRPGVAANQDSVARLTDALIQLRMAEAQAAREELKEQAAYLTPVQRARFYVMRERFAHRVKEVHGHRHGRSHMGRGRHRGKPWL